jgi:hypothetical protein
MTTAYPIAICKGVKIRFDPFLEDYLVTIDEAAKLDQEDFETIASWGAAHRREHILLYQYNRSDCDWSANFCDAEDLMLIIRGDCASDQERHAAIRELIYRLDLNETIKSESSKRAPLNPRPGFVYILKADNDLFKIGQAAVLDNRIKQLAVSLPYELALIHSMATDDMHSL